VGIQRLAAKRRDVVLVDPALPEAQAGRFASKGELFAAKPGAAPALGKQVQRVVLQAVADAELKERTGVLADRAPGDLLDQAVLVVLRVVLRPEGKQRIAGAAAALDFFEGGDRHVALEPDDGTRDAVCRFPAAGELGHVLAQGHDVFGPRGGVLPLTAAMSP